MGDAEIFGAGIFISFWVVSFFGFSAYQLRKTYKENEPQPLAVTGSSPEGHPLRDLPKHAN